MKHNVEISDEIRRANRDFNSNWIADQGLIGDAPVTLDELGFIEGFQSDSEPFQVVWLRNIDRLCDLLPVGFEFDRCGLVDVGCGSGISSIYFFMNYAFKFVQGFDLSTKLVDNAIRNRAALSGRGIDVDSLYFHVADARSHKIITDDPLALFMYNPFCWETMDCFVRNNHHYLCNTGSLLLYAHDLCVRDLGLYGQVLERDDFFNLSIIKFQA